MYGVQDPHLLICDSVMEVSMDRKLLSEFGYFYKGRSIYRNDTLIWPVKDFFLSFDMDVLFLTIQFKIKIN